MHVDRPRGHVEREREHPIRLTDMHERQRARHALTRAAADVDVYFSLLESDGRDADTPTAEMGPFDET